MLVDSWQREVGRSGGRACLFILIICEATPVYQHGILTGLEGPTGEREWRIAGVFANISMSCFKCDETWTHSLCFWLTSFPSFYFFIFIVYFFFSFCSFIHLVKGICFPKKVIALALASGLAHTFYQLGAYWTQAKYADKVAPIFYWKSSICLCVCVIAVRLTVKINCGVVAG